MIVHINCFLNLYFSDRTNSPTCRLGYPDDAALAGTCQTMQWPLPFSACPRHQAPIHDGPRAPAAAATERASSSHPTSSSTWSVPPPSSYASSSSTAAMLTYGLSPFDFIRSRFRRVATGRMGKLAWSRGATDVAVGERPRHDE
jgi:hypothetical protein